MPRCDHFDGTEIVEVPANIPGCPGCLATGDSWVHLRMCMRCGHVGCCDSSKNQHARQHFEDHDHVLIRSIEPGETWGYCYLDNQYTRLS